MRRRPYLKSLNAPFGAQCFPTTTSGQASVAQIIVSMHLLVLSAFRHFDETTRCLVSRSQCTFWCSVLSDARDAACYLAHGESQCTFWCSVLSDVRENLMNWMAERVSMHLLVLSAFRRM